MALIAFGNSVVTVLPSIGKYVGFFTKLLFGFGVAFELPVITFFLAKIGLVDDKSLKDFFKYAIVLIFVFSALLTPPDVLTQFLMAGPLIFLYGVSIYVAKVFNPYIAPEDAEEEDDSDDEDEDEVDDEDEIDEEDISYTKNENVKEENAK